MRSTGHNGNTVILNLSITYVLTTRARWNIDIPSHRFSAGASSVNIAFIITECIAEAADLAIPYIYITIIAFYIQHFWCHEPPCFTWVHIQPWSWLLMKKWYDGMSSEIKWDGRLFQLVNEGQGQNIENIYIVPRLIHGLAAIHFHPTDLHVENKWRIPKINHKADSASSLWMRHSATYMYLIPGIISIKVEVKKEPSPPL